MGKQITSRAEGSTRSTPALHHHLRRFAEEKLDQYRGQSDDRRMIAVDGDRREELLRFTCLVAAQWESASRAAASRADVEKEVALRMEESGKQLGAAYAAIAVIVGGEGVPLRIEVDPCLAPVARSSSQLGAVLRKIKELNLKLAEGNLQVPGRQGKLVRLRDVPCHEAFNALAEHLERLTLGFAIARRFATLDGGLGI